EHDHRGPHLAGAQLPAHFVAAEPGQHDVEDDRVVRAVRRLGGRPEPVDAVVHEVDGEPLGLQPVADRLGEVHLVVDHEYSHRRTVPRVHRTDSQTAAPTPAIRQYTANGVSVRVSNQRVRNRTDRYAAIPETALPASTWPRMPSPSGPMRSGSFR